MKHTSYVLQCAMLGDIPENMKRKVELKTLTADFEVVFPCNPNENCELLVMRHRTAHMIDAVDEVNTDEKLSDFQLR